MDELIVFLALGKLVKEATGRDCEEFFPQEVREKLSAYIDGLEPYPVEETTARLITLLEQAADRLLNKIDEEAA